MPFKRKLASSYTDRYKRARRTGTLTRGVRAVGMRKMSTAVSLMNRVKSNQARVATLYRMIETKESCRSSTGNVGLPHNNIYVLQDSSAGGALNMFRLTQGTGDPMGSGDGNRVGDQICIKGILVRGFFENALQRPRVYYRVMVLRGAKGETFDRTTIFKGDCGNKMIDQVNTERFTIVAQKIFTVSATNYNASTVSGTGVPYSSGNVSGDYPSGIATKTMKMWIPGSKFGKNGNIQFENASSTQVKFYDYRVVVLAYDWFGTPQDVNNVGKINDCYTKLYFKDA